MLPIDVQISQIFVVWLQEPVQWLLAREIYNLLPIFTFICHRNLVKKITIKYYKRERKRERERERERQKETERDRESQRREKVKKRDVYFMFNLVSHRWSIQRDS